MKLGVITMTAIMLIMCLTVPASASVWDDMKGFIGNSIQYLNGNTEQIQSHTEAIEPKVIVQDRVKDRVRAYNTPENVEKLSSEMKHYNVEAVCVDVTDTGERFYLVQGQGYTERYNGVVDLRVECSSEDIEFCLERVQDGKVKILERIEMANRLRHNIEYSNVKCSTFDFCLVGGIV